MAYKLLTEVLVLVRITAGHFVAGVVLEDGVVVRAAPILKWTRGMTEGALFERLNRTTYNYELFEERSMLKCLNCEPGDLKASVAVDYEVPLGATDGSIRVGTLKPSKVDIREAWQKLERRPIWCKQCHTMYVWDIKTQSLEQVDAW